MEGVATYFDGKTAKDHAVTVRLNDGRLTFAGPSVVPQLWRDSSVRSVERYSGHGPLRLVNEERPGERLIVPAGEFAASLVRRLPGLKADVPYKAFARLAAWCIGSAAAVAALGYGLFVFAPAQLAGWLPARLTAQMGHDMERTLVSGAKECTSPVGQRALSTMVARLSEGDDKLPPLTIHVYDMSLVNAFTLPGGRIVLTRGLINQAGTGDEVAGVLAHEMGHASLLHPEAQLVRLLGLDLVLKIFSGGTSGNTAANMAGLAAVLRSSRDAERKADNYARKVMLAAHIDPQGLQTFFKKMMRDSPLGNNKALDVVGNVLSTHPGLDERIHDFPELPAGAEVRPTLMPMDWIALQDICKTS